MGKKISKTNFKGIKQKIIDLELDFLEEQETNVLGNFSISESLAPANFSFKKINNEIESIQNPNIVEEKEFNVLKDSPLSLDDKFSELDDPIYNLDEQRTLLSQKAPPTAARKTKAAKPKTIARRLKATKKSINKKRY